MVEVTDIATRRRVPESVLDSITFVFGGVHYGTFPVSMPYTCGKPLVLYIVAQHDHENGTAFTGPIDALITDDAELGAALDMAR